MRTKNKHDAAHLVASRSLSEDQQRFCDELLHDHQFDFRAAGNRAGVSLETARLWLMQDRNVRGFISAALTERAERHADVRDRVIHALWSLASYDPRKAFRSDGVQLQPHELPDSLAAALTSCEPVMHNGEATGYWKYRFSDRTAVLIALLKHFGDIAGGRDMPTNSLEEDQRPRVTVVWRR